MYAMVAVLSVQTSTCLSCSSGLKQRRASHTASNSRQLICHCSRGPVQSPAAACPLHMAPQPMSEASVDTTTCLDTRTSGVNRKARSDHGLNHPGTTLLPWKDSRQFSIDWARSIERRAVRLTESNSIHRKVILCAGESLLFSQLTRSPNRLRWLSTVSLCSHNCAWDWASMSQSSR